MSVKRYELCHLGGGLYSMMEDSDGEFVRYEDHTLLEQKLTELAVQLANVESKCRELAAENAGLKESRKNLAEFIHEELDAGYPLNMSIETPATDAFLAEVRAQGVEMAACALDDVNQFNYAKMLDDLAQKIRQEAAQ